MSSLCFALIGCGRIAKRHSELLGHRQIVGAALTAVCDVVRICADAIRKRFEVPAYSNMHEMMAREKVDVAVVLTESGFHAEHVVALARHGKHIMVERPMALTLGDADLEDMVRHVAAAVIAGVSG
jgi:UDP-N-acetyl-2-amino-2-deoxyglucuronate dehydrogenase